MSGRCTCAACQPVSSQQADATERDYRILSGDDAGQHEDDAFLTRVRSGKDSRYILRGGCVLSMDRAVGDFAKADVLVDGGKIVAIAPEINADANVLDASGMIVAPGFVDTHRHCWQNAFRRFVTDVTLPQYQAFSNQIGAKMQPEDVYIASLVTYLGAIESGVTTLLDWSHISNSPEHSDAVVEAMRDSGIRGVYGYGYSRESDRSAYPEDIRRIHHRYFSSTDQLTTLCMAANVDRPHEWALARELGLRISAHVVNMSQWVEEAGREGRLGPDVTYIHCTKLSPLGWKMLRDSGATVSVATTSVAQLGVGSGTPSIQAALENGIRPSLSLDVEVSLAGDFFSQVQAAFAFQRSFANENNLAGKAAVELVSTRDVLEFATIEGAKANGLERKVGSLTPGKEADIMLIDANSLNNMPLNNAVATMVLGSSIKNIHSVFIAGKPVKYAGRVLDFDEGKLKAAIYASRDRVARAAELAVNVV